jgi:hemerythrin-like domain-containing protein
MTSGRTTHAASARTRAGRRGHAASSRKHSSHRGASGRRNDAIALLLDDHETLRSLLSRLHEAHSDSQRERLLGEVRAEIERHTTIEEEIFYPAFRDVAQTERDRELFHESTEEHHAASLVLNEISTSAEADVFAARAKVLKDMIEHHAEEEESEMFPRARRLLPRGELERLGQELAERKRSLGHNGTGGALQTVASLVRMPFSS